jgi:hypothetical protein
MGNAAQSGKRPISPVEKRVRERPSQLMAQLCAVWSEVEQALPAGHTLRLPHQRLNIVGLLIGYKLLSLCRSCTEQRKKSAAPASPTTPSPTSPPGIMLASICGCLRQAAVGRRYFFTRNECAVSRFRRGTNQRPCQTIVRHRNRGEKTCAKSRF